MTKQVRFERGKIEFKVDASHGILSAFRDGEYLTGVCITPWYGEKKTIQEGEVELRAKVEAVLDRCQEAPDNGYVEQMK